ncbi:cache domain-containing protein, partial [Paenibacillus sepulcri]|nr:cache domain-containing protein [Paenibacillus sepulcri]
MYGFQGEGRFFRRSLVTVIVIASLPGLLIGTGIYFVGSEQIASETNRLHQEQLEKARQSIDDQFAALEISLSHWAFDPQFDDKLKQLDPVYGYNQVQDIYKTLLVMKQLNPVIQQVRLYVEEPAPLLFTEAGFVRLTDDQYQEYHDIMMNQQNQAAWSGFDPEQEGYIGQGEDPEQGAAGKEPQLAAPLSLIHKIPGGSPRPFGMFLVTVDPDKLQEIVTILTPRNEGTSFLMKGNGEWIPPFGQGGDAKGLNGALRARVLEEHAAEDHFIFKWQEESYSVSYGTLNRLGEEWIYISATPLKALTGPVVFISRIILGFSCFGLLLAGVLSWFVSKR